MGTPYYVFILLIILVLWKRPLELSNYLNSITLKYFSCNPVILLPYDNFTFKIQPKSHLLWEALNCSPNSLCPFSNILPRLLSNIPPKCSGLLSFLVPQEKGFLIKKNLFSISVNVCLSFPLRRSKKKTWRARIYRSLVYPNTNHINFSKLDGIFNLNRI